MAIITSLLELILESIEDAAGIPVKLLFHSCFLRLLITSTICTLVFVSASAFQRNKTYTVSSKALANTALGLDSRILNGIKDPSDGIK